MYISLFISIYNCKLSHICLQITHMMIQSSSLRGSDGFIIAKLTLYYRSWRQSAMKDFI